MSDSKAIDISALVVSIVALGISVSTWLATRDQMQLTSGQVRADVQVEESSLIEPISKTATIRLELRIKNFGQTAATDVRGEMDYQVGWPDSKGEGNAATLTQIGSMAPGLERTVILQSNRMQREEWPHPDPRQESVYFYGTIWYVDDTTHETRKDDWCYELPLRSDAARMATQLQRCVAGRYVSKVVH